MNIIESNLQWRGLLQYGNKPNLIVLHHADSTYCTIEQIHQWHLNNGWSGCGYHFLIRKNGLIYRGRPENTYGSHTLGYNVNSLGVCTEGIYTSENMPGIQKNAVIELCKYLMNKYTIDAIKRHCDLFYTTCPGNNFPFDEIRNVLNYKSVSSAQSVSALIENESILYVQKTLNRLMITDEIGNILKEDGILGNQTIQAIKKFQKQMNLNPDGMISSITLDALKQILSKPICSLGVNHIYAIRYIQWRLGAAVNGSFNQDTMKKVKNYKKIINMNVDGIVDEKMWDRLIG